MILALMGGVVSVPSAFAQGQDPGVDQYVPKLPTAKGNKDGRTPSDSGSAQGEVTGSLPDSEEGEALGRIASDGDQGGASQREKRKKKPAKSTSSRSKKAEDGAAGSGGGGSGDGGATGAVSSAASDWEDPVVPIVAGLILLLALAATVIALRRRRTS